jgi:tetratricopeptide (TPR) repeat protein
MSHTRTLTRLLVLLAILAPTSRAQLGKTVLIPAGSEMDRQLNAIAAATDPAQKLQLLDEFAKAHPNDDFQIVADEQYVNYYITIQQYDKAFAYGDKLFVLDPDNFSNAVNMVRAANESTNTERLFAAGEKAGAILQRFKSSPPPAGAAQRDWELMKTQKLESIKEDEGYIEESLLSAANQQKDPAKKADLLVRFIKICPDSPSSEQALSLAAASYQQAQNPAKMLDLANGVLTKDPNNLGMLLLLSDYYSENGQELEKAEAYAKKVISLCDSAKKPANLTDEQWQTQKSLQKGIALSAVGRVNLEKKDNLSAVKNLTAAAPLLKSDASGYARNQYRLGYAYLNMKKNTEARQAFTEAASVESPYKGPAQDKLKSLGGGKPPVGKKPT